MGDSVASARMLWLVAVSIWPLLVGVLLDVIDFLLLGDALQGVGWSLAGGIGVLTASLPAIAACALFDARSLHAHLIFSFGVGCIVAVPIVVVATVKMDAFGFGTLFYLGAILVVGGACASGWMFWLIRRPDRDARAP